MIEEYKKEADEEFTNSLKGFREVQAQQLDQERTAIFE
jgi:hypothetical protein